MADAPKDLAEIFDLDRAKLTKKLVADMVQCLHDIDSAQEDLKQVVASAKEAQFSRRDITAMRQIAKLQQRDEITQAREQMETLHKVGHAVGVDLFTWAEKQDGPDGK